MMNTSLAYDYIFDFSSNLLSNILSNLFYEIVTFLILLRIGTYYGFYERAKRYLLLIFRKIQIRFSVDYDSTIDLTVLTEIVKKYFKNSYGQSSIEVKSLNENSFQFVVNNEYYVTIEKNVNDALTFRTSKITSTRKEIIGDIRTFFDTLRDIENEVMGLNNKFNPKSFFISLTVPYVSTYMKFYEPKGLKVKKYVIELEEIIDQKSNNSSSTKYEIQLIGDIININSNYRDKITELVNKFV